MHSGGGASNRAMGMAGTLDSRAAFTAMVGVSIDTLGFWYRLLGSRSWYDFSGGGAPQYPPLVLVQNHL